MFCRECGTQLPENIRFCRACGAKVQKDTVGIPVQQTEARWESKTLQIMPSDEEDTIEEYQLFGWELLSSQTIDRKDSHLENNFGTIYSVTESVNYVKLTFRRNMNMSGYSEIADLENKYRSFDSIYEPDEPGKAMLVIGILGILSCFIGLLIIGLPVAVICIGMYIKRKNTYDKEYEEYTKLKEEANKQKYIYLEEAKNWRAGLR